MSEYTISITTEQGRALELMHIDVYEYVKNIIEAKANQCINELLDYVSNDNNYYLTDVQISNIQSKMNIINKGITNLKDLPIDIKHQIIRSMKPVSIPSISVS